MKAWWAALSRRERVTLGAGAYALALIVVWFGIVRPLGADNVRLRAGVALAQGDYAWMRRAAAQIGQLRASGAVASHTPGAGQGAGQPGGLLAQINTSLAGAGLAANLQSMRPDSDHKVYVVLKGCAYTDLSQWLAGLTRAGIHVAEAQIDRRGPDEVDARVSLARGGA